MTIILKLKCSKVLIVLTNKTYAITDVPITYDHGYSAGGPGAGPAANTGPPAPNGDYSGTYYKNGIPHSYNCEYYYSTSTTTNIKINSYDIKGRSYIETPQKYYFSDLGLRNVRINFRQIEPTHSMENIIYNELRMRGYNVDVGVIPITELKDGKQQRKQLEIDFVCNKGSSRYYIQSAYSIPDEEKRRQEIRPFGKIKDAFKKIVITGDIIKPHYDENGIFMVNIYDFLLDPTIIEK